MEQCSAALIVDMHGTVGIEMKSMIPASMKQRIYETEVAATLKDILCCKCTCQSGSQGEERVVCVHTFRLYLLSILLHQNLAEHILLELAARIGGGSDVQHTCDQTYDVSNDRTWMWDLNTWSDEVLKEMTNNVIILMSVAGKSSHSCNLVQSLPEMLEIFIVGTEKRKA